MAQAEKKELNAEDAIDIAFDLFEKYVKRGAQLRNVLLEELEPDEGGWIVSIGFDGSREETTQPASAGSFSALAGFGSVKKTTVREIRHIYLDEEGNFLRIR